MQDAASPAAGRAAARRDGKAAGRRDREPWAAAGPPDGPQVVAVAHADQIGLIVTHVDEAGFVRFDAVGWLDHQLLPGHTVLIHTAGGPVRGVVGRPPTHIVPEAERGKAAPIKEQFVDIGASSTEPKRSSASRWATP